MIRWLLPRWPMILIRSGFALFAIACIESDRWPIEALLVGPALMLVGVVQILLLPRSTSSSSPASPAAPDRSSRSSR